MLLQSATVPEQDNCPFYCNVCLNLYEGECGVVEKIKININQAWGEGSISLREEGRRRRKKGTSAILLSCLLYGAVFPETLQVLRMHIQ
jgi:hypothetical protein